MCVCVCVRACLHWEVYEWGGRGREGMKSDFDVYFASRSYAGGGGGGGTASTTIYWQTEDTSTIYENKGLQAIYPITASRINHTK